VKIFVSYSRRDADFAQHVHEYFLDSRHNIFTDVNNIEMGDVWSSIIEKNISNCDIFVVLVTHASLRSSEIEKEVLQAKKENKTIIPCIHRDVSHGEIRWDLNKLQGIEFEDKYELARNLFSRIERSKQKGPKVDQTIPSITSETKSESYQSAGSTNTIIPPLVSHYYEKQETGDKRRRRISLKVLLPIIGVVALVGAIIAYGFFDSTDQRYDVQHGVMKENQSSTSQTPLTTLNGTKEAVPEELKYYDQALVARPYDTGLLNDRGDVYYFQGDYVRAIQDYDRVLAINPNNTYALYSKGMALNNLGSPAQGLPYVDKALSIDPNDDEFLNSKVTILNDLGDHTLALQYVDQVLANDPNNEDALNNKGLTLNKLGNYTQALTYLDKALAIDPNDEGALNNKGWALNELGNYTQALTYLDKAFAIDPNDEDIISNRADALNNLA
jgi:Flp pilus assembly protein TadD